MSYYVYILLCSDNSLYTGYTSNLKKRVQDHNNGKGSKILRGKLPVRLIHSEKFETKSAALKREWQIKDWKRIKKIETLKLKI